MGREAFEVAKVGQRKEDAHGNEGERKAHAPLRRHLRARMRAEMMERCTHARRSSRSANSATAAYAGALKHARSRLARTCTHTHAHNG